MATANLAPPDRANKAKQAELNRRINSADPAERYHAKQEVLTSTGAAFGKAMVQQAKEKARAAERQERELQRYEKQYFRSKYKEI